MNTVSKLVFVIIDQQNSSCMNLTWDDWAFNTQCPAVLDKLDELLHIIEQLSDDDLSAGVNLHAATKLRPTYEMS